MDDEKRSRLICELSDSDRLGTPSPTSTFSSSPIPSPKSSSPPIPSPKSSSPPIPSPKSSSQPPSSSSSSSDGVSSSYQPQRPPSSSAPPRSLKRKFIDNDDLEGSLLSSVKSVKGTVILYFRTEKRINRSDLDVLQRRWRLLASSLTRTGGDRSVVRKSFSELCDSVWDGLAKKKNDRYVYLEGLKHLLGKLNQLQSTYPDDCQQRFSQMMKRCNLRCAGGEDFAFIKLLVVVRADPGLPDNDNSKQLLALLNKKEVVYGLCSINYSVVPPTILGDSKDLRLLGPIDQVPMIKIDDEQSIYEFSSIMKKIEDTFIDRENYVR